MTGQVFSLARLPRIEFGAGRFAATAGIAARYGSRALLVTGARSFSESVYWKQLQSNFAAENMAVVHVSVGGEPSPEWVDEVVREHAGDGIDVVVAVGGGSALDAGKSVAGLLRTGNSVMDYLEGVGPELAYAGPAVPLIAVPTTAGTGSEATKNGVLSRQGTDGFKKSFRDEQLVAEYAIVDPDLLASCPRQVIAANGMDALTQLMESYVSPRSNRFTDALGVEAIRAARDGLLPLHASDGGDAAARERMAWAALVSGINLAQTGLGSVHGLASPLGAYYPIPHGVVCGTLVAEATRVNIQAMRQREPENPALARYAKLGALLCGRHFGRQEDAHQALVEVLEVWTERLVLPRLATYGLDAAGYDQVVANCRGSSMRTNPIVLDDAEIRGVLAART